MNIPVKFCLFVSRRNNLRTRSVLLHQSQGDVKSRWDTLNMFLLLLFCAPHIQWYNLQYDEGGRFMAEEGFALPSHLLAYLLLLLPTPHHPHRPPPWILKSVNPEVNNTQVLGWLFTGGYLMSCVYTVLQFVIVKVWWPVTWLWKFGDLSHGIFLFSLNLEAFQRG